MDASWSGITNELSSVCAELANQWLEATATALLLANERERNWSHLPGTFTTKALKGADYVYFQYSDPGGTRRQFSVGRHSDALDAIINSYTDEPVRHESDLTQLTRLSALLRAGGVAMVPHGPARVIRALADAGLFAAGGVLIGSYAFQVLGNLLGVEWPGAAWRTQDVDIAGQLLVAVPPLQTDVPKRSGANCSLVLPRVPTFRPFTAPTTVPACA